MPYQLRPGDHVVILIAILAIAGLILIAAFAIFCVICFALSAVFPEFMSDLLGGVW